MMKITKEQLKQIIKEEMNLTSLDEAQAFDPEAILVELQSMAQSIGHHGDKIDIYAPTDSDVWKVSSELFAVSRALQAVTQKLSAALRKPRGR